MGKSHHKREEHGREYEDAEVRTRTPYYLSTWYTQRAVSPNSPRTPIGQLAHGNVWPGPAEVWALEPEAAEAPFPRSPRSLGQGMGQAKFDAKTNAHRSLNPFLNLPMPKFTPS